MKQYLETRITELRSQEQQRTEELRKVLTPDVLKLKTDYINELYARRKELEAALAHLNTINEPASIQTV
jgi:hypothetical protein